MRSYGENKYEVAAKAEMYMRGLQDNKILAVAKHFPGHGNTNVDSPHDLPIVNKNKPQLLAEELYPFRKLFAAGVGGVMTAHLQIPALDTATHVGASLSPAITTTLLRGELGFGGITFSDALNMKGVAKYYDPGELELKALQAGNDVLLYSEDVPRAINYIADAVQEGCVDSTFISSRVKRILQVKYWAGLKSCERPSANNIGNDLNNADALMLQQELAASSALVVSDKDELIPFTNLQKKKIALVAIGALAPTVFQEHSGQYAPLAQFNYSKYTSAKEWDKLYDSLQYYDQVIVALYALSYKNTETYGVTDRSAAFIKRLSASKQVVLTLFGSPYTLSWFPDSRNIVIGWSQTDFHQLATAELLFGAAGTKATLPVSASTMYNAGKGTPTSSLGKLGYAVPEQVGMSSEVLARIEPLVTAAIEDRIMPGAQILVARKGKIVYQHSFGNQTYEDKKPIRNSDLYDVASITKAAATTLMAMKLYELGKLELENKLHDYLPSLRGTDKGGLMIKEIMAHQAGLQAWIPFYQYTLNESGVCDSNYCYAPSTFAHRVADGLYLYDYYTDTMLRMIDQSKLDQAR